MAASCFAAIASLSLSNYGWRLVGIFIICCYFFCLVAVFLVVSCILRNLHQMQFTRLEDGGNIDSFVAVFGRSDMDAFFSIGGYQY